MIDVIPFGDGQVMIRLFPVPPLPPAVVSGGYHEASLRVAPKDGRPPLRLEGIAHRPDARNNVFGIHAVDHLVLLVATELAQAELAGAAVEVVRWGASLSEAEAKARLRRT